MSVPFTDYLNIRPKKKNESSIDSNNNEGNSTHNRALDYHSKKPNDCHNSNATSIIRFNCEICTEPKSIIQDYITEHIKPLLNSQRMAPKRLISVMKDNTRSIVKKQLNGSGIHKVAYVSENSNISLMNLIRSIDKDDKKHYFIFLCPSMWELKKDLLYDTGADIIELPYDMKGGLVFDEAFKRLEDISEDDCMALGIFSASCRTTGMLLSIKKIADGLRALGALAICDFSSMTPSKRMQISYIGYERKEMCLDAAFVSPSNIIGGQGCPGLLIFREDLITESMIEHINGIRIGYYNGDGYHSIVNSTLSQFSYENITISQIKTGLAFQLHDACLTTAVNKTIQESIIRIRIALENNLAIKILPNLGEELSHEILFNVQEIKSEWLLHYNFISQLFWDLFEIEINVKLLDYNQLKIMQMMGLDHEKYLIPGMLNESYDQEKVMVPGFIKLDMHYLITQDNVDRFLEAIDMISEDGWKLLHKYEYDSENGKWKASKLLKSGKNPGKARYIRQKLLKLRRLSSSSSSSSSIASFDPNNANLSWKSKLTQAADLIEENMKFTKSDLLSENKCQGEEGLSRESQELRWFILPIEVEGLLKDPVFVQQDQSEENKNIKKGQKERIKKLSIDYRKSQEKENIFFNFRARPDFNKSYKRIYKH